VKIFFRPSSVACLLLLAANAFAVGNAGADGVVALVNGTAIRGADLSREMKRIGRGRAARSGESGVLPQEAIRSEAMENLIRRELLYQESRKKGITVTPATVDREMEKLRKKVAGAGELDEVLHGMELDEVVVRNDVARGIAIRELIDREIASGVEVSEREAVAYYDRHPDEFGKPKQVRVRHILVRTDGLRPEEKAAKLREMEGVRTRLLAGEEFAELARRYSDCPSRTAGGDLGYYGPGQLTTPMDTAVFSQTPGAVGDVIEDRFGFHLVRVTDIRPASTYSFGEVREKAIQRVRQEKTGKELGRHLRELKARSVVVVY